ncbi:MAG: hypothetical protein CM15mP125_3670 [Gammaproteobacteria bacterium]|nr:MAG: hypothetical protein CM15mP125_3670 [Gammaproteobacteria bacterium]
MRYDVADDWISLCKELWTVEGEFDYAGPHFTSPGCYSEPKPLQKPWPALMSAGNSPGGKSLPQPMRTLTLWSRKIWRPRETLRLTAGVWQTSDSIATCRFLAKPTLSAEKPSKRRRILSANTYTTAATGKVFAIFLMCSFPTRRAPR